MIPPQVVNLVSLAGIFMHISVLEFKTILLGSEHYVIISVKAI